MGIHMSCAHMHPVIKKLEMFRRKMMPLPSNWRPIELWCELCCVNVLERIGHQNEELSKILKSSFFPQVPTILETEHWLTLPLQLCSLLDIDMDIFFVTASGLLLKLIDKVESSLGAVIAAQIYRECEFYVSRSTHQCLCYLVHKVFAMHPIVPDTELMEANRCVVDPSIAEKFIHSMSLKVDQLNTVVMDVTLNISLPESSVALPSCFTNKMPEFITMSILKLERLAKWINALDGYDDYGNFIATHVEEPSIVSVGVPWLIQTRIKYLIPMIDRFSSTSSWSDHVKNKFQALKSFDASQIEANRKRKREEDVAPDYSKFIIGIHEILNSNQLLAPNGKVKSDFCGLTKAKLVTKQYGQVKAKYETIVSLSHLGDLREFLGIIRSFLSGLLTDGGYLQHKEDACQALFNLFCDSERTTFAVWKKYGNHPNTIPDGLCGWRALFQLMHRFIHMFEHFEERIPEAAREWRASKLWSVELEKVYTDLVADFTHHADNDVLTSNKQNVIAFMSRVLNMLNALSKSAELDHYNRAHLERLRRNILILIPTIKRAGGADSLYLPGNFFATKELWCDILELVLISFDLDLFYPFLAFREIGPDVGYCYMEFYMSNRLFNKENNPPQFKTEFGGQTFTNQNLTFSFGFSNALVYINQNHFVVHDLHSPGREMKFFEEAVMNLARALINQISSFVDREYDNLNSAIAELDLYLERYGHELNANNKDATLLRPSGGKKEEKNDLNTSDNKVIDLISDDEETNDD